MIKVLYEDNHLLCVEKPVNVPVQEDSSGSPDLLNLCKAYIREKYGKPGNVYLGLVHRLDRPVGGVMVFARTSKAASRLSESIRTHALKKVYMAVTDGIPERDEAVLTDWLEKDSRTNTVHVTDSGHGRKAVLSYRIIARNKKHALVEIHLETGRPHQIRVQFASRGTPLVNDQRYNRNAGRGQIALWAYQLEFPHPVTKETVHVESVYPQTWPWNEFGGI
ncbi:MAG: RluA family pseudouridine synthase [Solobacterium sp.]|nr:RluA family pseudouridine synthase [Solobacterium sp.]